MNKKNNTFVGELFFFMILLIGSLFIYLFALSEIKVLSKEKDNLENLVSQKTNDKEQLLAELQILSSEDRIVRIAADSIGLVRSSKIYESIYVDELIIDRVGKIVEDKYEKF